MECFLATVRQEERDTSGTLACGWPTCTHVGKEPSCASGSSSWVMSKASGTHPWGASQLPGWKGEGCAAFPPPLPPQGRAGPNHLILPDMTSQLLCLKLGRRGLLQPESCHVDWGWVLPCPLKTTARWAEICLSCIKFKSRGIPLVFPCFFSYAGLLNSWVFEAQGGGWKSVLVSFQVIGAHDVQRSGNSLTFSVGRWDTPVSFGRHNRVSQCKHVRQRPKKRKIKNMWYLNVILLACALLASDKEHVGFLY